MRRIIFVEAGIAALLGCLAGGVRREGECQYRRRGAWNAGGRAQARSQPRDGG